MMTVRPEGQGPEMAGSAAKDHVVYPLQKRVVNPIVMLAHNLGIPPPGDALLETTGRRTGRSRHTPVCDGLDGDTFWLVAQRVVMQHAREHVALTPGRTGLPEAAEEALSGEARDESPRWRRRFRGCRARRLQPDSAPPPASHPARPLCPPPRRASAR
jgi:hypothetical protein